MKGWKDERREKYLAKLRDPRWQKRRLKILERDKWECQMCCDRDSTLVVHHVWYSGQPWDAPDEALVTLCEACHESPDRPYPRSSLAIEQEDMGAHFGRLATIEEDADFIECRQDWDGHLIADPPGPMFQMMMQNRLPNGEWICGESPNDPA